MRRAVERKPTKKGLDPTGIEEIDRLATLSPCTIQDYITGVSSYVRRGSSLKPSTKKAAQIRLSNALARSLADELSARFPILQDKLVTNEQKVAGGLRTVNADVSESHILDGLRLAVELKPINLAVGRAIWNRFGDIRTFAVNIHLKFPFAVVGGVLVIPTHEVIGLSVENSNESAEPYELEQTEASWEENDSREAAEITIGTESVLPDWKSTLHLVERAIERLIRAGGRKSEAEAAHLLEGIAVVVYDPAKGTIHPEIPKPGSGLRWEEFVDALLTSYRARFED